MSAIQLFLNDQLVTITAESPVIKRLNEDDQYLADYINKAAKMGQFSFLFNDHPVKRIIVRRATPSNVVKPVWYKKGRPSETDTNATGLLLKLRGSDKYQSRFKDVRSYSSRTKLWEELANEMRLEGYDVDGHKCSQKFLNLAQCYYRYKNFVESCNCSEQKIYPPEFYAELHKILGDKKAEESDDDEEWLPRSKRRRRNVEGEEDGEEDFFKRFLKKSSEEKEERFREISDLIKKRNSLITQKIKQNDRIISLLEQFVKN